MSSEQSSRRRGAALAVSILVLLGGCGDAPTPPPASASPAPQASSAVSREQLQSWISFRLVYGLRSDLEWVVAVANNPAASDEIFDVPLLPDELARVGEAISSAQNLVSVARGYGNQSPDEFAGAWIELPTVVLAFSDRIGEHREEIAALFGDRVVARLVRYSLRDLQTFAGRVGAERAWFPTVGVEFIQADIEEQFNVVEFSYRAPNAGVAALIRERLGQPDWLRLDYWGPGHWTGPVGDLELTVVDHDGQPVAIECLLRTLDPRVTTENAPREIQDGRCFDKALPAVEWTAEITYVDDGASTTISRTFVVPAGGVVRLEVVINR